MILDFGEHNGTNVKDTPLKYIIFLAGYHMQGAKRKSISCTGKEWLTKHVKEFHEYALVYLTKRCWHCGRKHAKRPAPVQASGDWPARSGPGTASK